MIDKLQKLLQGRTSKTRKWRIMTGAMFTLKKNRNRMRVTRFAMSAKPKLQAIINPRRAVAKMVRAVIRPKSKINCMKVSSRLVSKISLHSNNQINSKSKSKMKSSKRKKTKMKTTMSSR